MRALWRREVWCQCQSYSVTFVLNLPCPHPTSLLLVTLRLLFAVYSHDQLYTDDQPDLNLELSCTTCVTCSTRFAVKHYSTQEGDFHLKFSKPPRSFSGRGDFLNHTPVDGRTDGLWEKSVAKQQKSVKVCAFTVLTQCISDDQQGTSNASQRKGCVWRRVQAGSPRRFRTTLRLAAIQHQHTAGATWFVHKEVGRKALERLTLTASAKSCRGCCG